MLKKDARYHYGIKKHICGTDYRDDFWVTGDDFYCADGEREGE